MTSRRAMLAAMGGLPFTRPDQHYEPPDGAITPGSRSGIVKAREVIIVGTGPTSGLFAYSPTLGLGHLVASVTALTSTGADPFGNQVLPGVAEYKTTGGPPFAAASLTNGQLTLWTASLSHGPWTQQGIIGADTSGDLLLEAEGTGVVKTPLQQLVASVGLAVTGGITADTEAISSGQVGGLLLQVTNTTGSPTAPNVRITSQTAGDPAFAVRVAGDSFNRVIVDDNGTTGGRIRAGSGTAAPDVALYRAAANQWAMDYLAFNNAGSAENWQTVGGTGAAFAGTWANAAAPGVSLKYRRNAAPYQSVHWVGRVTNTVLQAAGSAITAAVPAAYRPSNTHDITCFNITSGAVVRVSIGSTGVLTCQSAIAANDVIGIPDVQIGLDA